MADVLEIRDLVVCQKIHGCGFVADNPAPLKSNTPVYKACACDKEELVYEKKTAFWATYF